MHAPILRWVSGVALALCLAPLDAGAGAIEAPRSAEDSERIGLDVALGAALAASAFDARELVDAESAWFDETQRRPVAASVAPLRGFVLENPYDVARRHADGLASVDRGSTVVDAWFLLAVPFLMPVILRRRPRGVRRSWPDQLGADRGDGPAFGAIGRGPFGA